MADSYSTGYNGDKLLAVIILLLILTFFSVSLRCYVRLRITKAFELDDCLMVISQVSLFPEELFDMAADALKAMFHGLLLVHSRRLAIWPWKTQLSAVSSGPC